MAAWKKQMHNALEVGKMITRWCRRYRLGVSLVTAALFLFILLCALGPKAIRPYPPRKDGQEYVLMAYHMLKHGVASVERSLYNPEPEPSYYRMPGYPLYLAGLMIIHPQLRQLDGEAIFSIGKGQRQLDFIRFSHVFLFALTCLLGAVLIKKLTGSTFLAWATLFLLGFGRRVIVPLWEYRTEHLSTPLVLGLSCAIFAVLRKPGLWRFLILAVVLTALVMTRSAYSLLWPFLTAFILLVAWRKKWHWRQFVPGLLLFLVIHLAVVEGWKERNQAHFDHRALTWRSGFVMSLRMRYDQMNFQEWVSSFFLWSRSNYTSDHLLPRLWELWGWDGEALEADEEDFYDNTKARRNAIRDLVRPFMPENRYVEYYHGQVDEFLKEEALTYFKAHPWQHLRTSLPVMMRSANNWESTVVGYLSMFFAFWGVLLHSLWRRNWDFFGVLFPAFYYMPLIALLTHGRSRFMDEMLPLVLIALIVGAWQIAGWAWKKYSPKMGMGGQ